MNMFIDVNLKPIFSGTWVYQEVQYPSKIFNSWTDTALSSVGIYRVRPVSTEVPENMYIAGYTYEIVGDHAEATPILEPIPVVVPEVVSRAQGKAALVSAGLWDSVIQYVDGLQGGEKIMAEIALNDTTEWRRDSNFLSQAAQGIGLSENQLDNLFITASSIIL